jgi:CDP-paratose 2-epimerase
VRTVVITGSGGLIGAQAVRWFAGRAERVIGIDNDMRAYFFGDEASTRWAVADLGRSVPNFVHVDADIRDRERIAAVFAEHSSDIELVIHTAAQPSHDWAATEPFTDFDVNAGGTLNLLEQTRRHCPSATFVFTSTNKVYGDTPNRLPLVETSTRWTLDESHPWAEHGIPEEMSLDQTTHSLFGASKVAADVMVQEYGRYFGMNTGVFRGGCLTGPGHSGAPLHGFLAYLMKCTATGRPYSVLGYKGKQVRDNIHADDLVRAFDAFHAAPRSGEAYNLGGGPTVNCSMLEAIDLCQRIAGRELRHTYVDENRIGDHIWWVSDIRKFREHYPSWSLQYDLEGILRDIHDHGIERWAEAS